VGAALPLGGLLAACGGDSGGAAGDGRQVTLLLDITPYGKHAMFYVPLERGYWEERGISVVIQSAQGSADNVSKVGAKAAEFGFADAGSLIIGRATGANVKEIAMVHYRNLQSIISLESNPITSPEELVGRNIGATTGDAPRALLPGLARINDFNADDVNLINIEQATKPAALTQGRVDGTMDFYTAFPAYQQAAEQADDSATSFLYADFGLDLYNNGIIAHDDTLEDDPDLVRRFVEGFIEGVVWTVENPDEATSILIEAQPGLSQDVAREQLQVAIDHLMVDEVQDHGVGPMEKEKMQFTLDTISRYFDLEREVTLEEIYTNEFAPADQIPQV
jgi:NitT/TauT family transport system substrate-binding protein